MSHYNSNGFTASSGVPRGSRLGPLLFIMFINDLPSIFDDSVNILLFVDDAKIFSIVKSPADNLIVQSNLDKYTTWCRHNRIPLNKNKCSVNTFSRIENDIT